jgi:glycosyltransferase involved in cell wall biosynthesis
MKLLFYDFQIPDLLKNAGDATGGAAVRQNAIAQGIIKQGHRVGVLTWKGAKDYIGKPVKFDLVESYIEKKGIRGIRFFYYRLPALYKAVKSYSPDFLLHKGSDSPTGVVAFLGALLKIRFVFMAASDKDADDRYKNVHGLLPQILFRYGLKRAVLIVCQNNYQYQGFKKQFPEKEIMLMHNPFFTDEKLPPLVPKEQRKYVSWIGNFVAVKNLGGLYKIVQTTPDIQFKIAGTIKKNTDPETHQYLDLLEAAPNVEFVGYLKRQQILPFLSKSIALINTSHLEGFSNTYLEAFAAGTPVITRIKTDPDRIIARHRLGIVVESLDQIPKSIYALYNDTDFTNLSARCRTYVKSCHDPEKLTLSLIQKLQKIRNIH